MQTTNEIECWEASNRGTPVLQKVSPLMICSSPSIVVPETPPVPCAPAPIGVFWDIENCAVPSRKSASAVVAKIRERYFVGRKEAEFVCVTDINKQKKSVIQELNYAQVTVVHIDGVSKNTSDDKIRQMLRHFADDHIPPSVVVLISGDVNFVPELSDLRFRHHLYVIVIHPVSASSVLLAVAHEHCSYQELCADIPDHIQMQEDVDKRTLLVTNLPLTGGMSRVYRRLLQISANCRGKILNIKNGAATMTFPSNMAALRAQQRMDGEDVFGYHICVRHTRGLEAHVPREGNDSNADSLLREYYDSINNENEKSDGYSSDSDENVCDEYQLKEQQQLRLGFLIDSSIGRYGLNDSLAFEQVNTLNERERHRWISSLSPTDRRLAEFEIEDDVEYFSHDNEIDYNPCCAHVTSKLDKDGVLLRPNSTSVGSRAEDSSSGRSGNEGEHFSPGANVVRTDRDKAMIDNKRHTNIQAQIESKEPNTFTKKEVNYTSWTKEESGRSQNNAFYNVSSEKAVTESSPRRRLKKKKVPTATLR